MSGHPAAGLLLDDTGELSVRQVLGQLLRRASRADFAVSFVRLAGIDLGTEELRSVHCRLLLGRLSAGALDPELGAAEPGGRRHRARTLLDFLDSGRVEVRSAGAGAWAPDFSVLEVGGEAVTLVGGHYFARPEPAGGTVLTCLLRSPGAARRARERFEALWGGGYDVSAVVREALEALGR